MPDYTPAPPPSGPNWNAIIIAVAAVCAAAVITTGIYVTNTSSSDGDSEAAPTESATTTEAITPAVEEEPTPEDDEPEVFTLKDSVEYEDGIELSLSDYTRGVSGEWASPENAPYIRFTVKITNGSDATLNLAEMYVLCQYGDEGQEGEQVYDSGKGLDGTPSTHLRPARSITAKLACELPKDETYVQIELSPTYESETAIFQAT
jgi:hypothetical protein